jgi:hypothetical protein
MTTATRRSRHHLPQSGVPLDPSRSTAGHRRKAALPGLPRASIVARVQAVEPPRSRARLAWGIADGKTLLFEVDDVTAGEFRARLETGDQPTAIVEPVQIVAMDLER